MTGHGQLHGGVVPLPHVPFSWQFLYAAKFAPAVPGQAAAHVSAAVPVIVL
jgi:hypothetical protein